LLPIWTWGRGYERIPDDPGRDGNNDFRPCAVEWGRVCLRPRDVGSDDGRHDAALGGARNPNLRASRPAGDDRSQFAATGWFAAGYLLAWTGFALIATGSQWAFDRASLLDPKFTNVSNVVGGLVLILAGAYQWTPLKDTCLTKCQSPFVFIQQNGGFRRSIAGSLLLGLRHGSYCVGCRWALMALSFVGGVMNMLWMAAIALVILLEKTVTSGRLMARVVGVGS